MILSGFVLVRSIKCDGAQKKTSRRMRMPRKAPYLIAGMDVFDRIADSGEVLLKSLLADDYGAAAVIGMEGKRRGFLETAVQKKDDVMFGIINESERTNRTGFESQIAHHPFG